MKITKININNFKSFGRQELELNNVNILVGANGSGKTNFLEVFEFLKNLKKIGIHEAVSEFGGFLDLKNFNSSKTTINIKIEIEDGSSKLIKTPEKNNPNNNQIRRIRDRLVYEITIIEKNIDIKEELKFVEQFIETTEQGVKIKDLSSKFEYSIKNTFGTFEIPTNEKHVEKYNLSNGIKPRLDITTPFHRKFLTELQTEYQKQSLLLYPGVFIPSNLFDFGIYDFEPKQAKGYKTNAYAKHLDKNGENLALIIQEILKDEEKSEQFISDISSILSFINKISINNFENEIDIRVKENCNKVATKSKLLSDGTITIISIVVALYYQEHSIIFIEEPENGIHPSLIGELVDMIHDVAENLNKQVIITTHSPEILRLNGKDRIKNLLLIEKKDCSSKIIIPGEESKAVIKAFLNNGLGLDTLFIQNLLDA